MQTAVRVQVTSTNDNTSCASKCSHKLSNKTVFSKKKKTNWYMINGGKIICKTTILVLVYKQPLVQRNVCLKYYQLSEICHLNLCFYFLFAQNVWLLTTTKISAKSRRLQIKTWPAKWSCLVWCFYWEVEYDNHLIRWSHLHQYQGGTNKYQKHRHSVISYYWSLHLAVDW